MRYFDLQRFAAGDNNDLSARSYQPQFKELLQAVVKKNAYFIDFFGGAIEAMDGVKFNAKAFSVKTSDIPVVVGTYDTGADVAFGTGTANSSRFGNRTEIIYTDTDVPYSWGWAFHEGIDRHTVNNDLDVAIADRLELQARAKTAQFNAHHGAFISTNAGKTDISMASVSWENVLAAFDALDGYYTDIEAVGTKVAKVTPAVYNVIVDGALTTTGKLAGVNIATNGVLEFKGFQIEKVPTSLFQSGEAIYTYITGVGKAFTGITTARTIESEDFDGVALQGAGLAGEYILPDNKKAVAKVAVTGA